jgi:hypothetical protein
MSVLPSVIQAAVCSREALGNSGIRVLCARSRAARKSINSCGCSGGSASSFGNARNGSRAGTMNSWFLSAVGWRCFGQNRGGLFDEPVRHGGFMRLPEDFMQGFAWGQVFGFLVNCIFPSSTMHARASPPLATKDGGLECRKAAKAPTCFHPQGRSQAAARGSVPPVSCRLDIRTQDQCSGEPGGSTNRLGKSRAPCINRSAESSAELWR